MPAIDQEQDWYNDTESRRQMTAERSEFVPNLLLFSALLVFVGAILRFAGIMDALNSVPAGMGVPFFTTIAALSWAFGIVVIGVVLLTLRAMLQTLHRIQDACESNNSKR